MDGLAERTSSMDMTLSSSQSMVLDLPPSCIEFCPAHPSYFLVGTYNLQKEEVEGGEPEEQENEEKSDVEKEEGQRSQSRTGSIIVFQLQNGKARRIQTIPQPSAVFDLHFAPQSDRGDICAAVSSTGTISLFRLCPETETEVLQPLGLSGLEIHNSEETALLTYFAWHPTVPGLMAVTTASGKVIFVQLDEAYQEATALGSPAIEHTMEAWCVAFSDLWDESAESKKPSPLSTVFSGGDDSALILRPYWLAENDSSDSINNSNEEPGEDSNDDSDGDSNDSPVRFHRYDAKTVKGHEAGVTAILPLPLTMPDGSQFVLTGSYDDTLRAWVITPPHKNYGMLKSRKLAEENLGGGVWRLKVIEELSSLSGPGPWTVVVLASCMHAGSRIIRIRIGADPLRDLEIEVLARFEEHKSMNYGSDYSRIEGALVGKEGKKEVVCVSTSFYDRLLCVWEFEAPV
ncbi:hypothetical protein VMCG_03697 [Cytospora schulzeri]|uniref:methylated diphthine methylhydrolase n=1 Tax=Cytospora schulzeri TaxID=448051 RepID=A0A423WUP6_9PEZI|nr:hypothetical protein VMCG_03697 [Valsa malicola]